MPTSDRPRSIGLELRLLGTGQASYRDRSLPGFPHQLPYLLLCYLLLNRDTPQPREQVATIFWGDYPTNVSLKYLRNALWRLRQLFHAVDTSLDEYLAISDHAISFSPSSDYWLDIELFEAAVVPYQNLAGSELKPEQARILEQAVDLYTGDLLDGIYGDWCLYDRERLLMLHLNNLSSLMAFHEAQGTYERALAYGARLLACDGTRENTHRQMMRLYWHSGDRNAALMQYKRCAGILRETMNIDPSAETVHLYQQILKRPFPVPAPSLARTGPENEDRSGESIPLLLDQAHHRLQQLQATFDKANEELSRLSDLLQKIQAQQDAEASHKRQPGDAI